MTRRGSAPRVGFGVEAARRTRMRELGWRHGLEGKPKEYDDPEYLVSYRRGKERKGEESG